MSVLIYSGGFAPVGGIETFLFDLALHLRRCNLKVSLRCWGAPNKLLNQLRDEGVTVTRLPFRWGCRWDWPDKILYSLAHEDVRRASVVVLGKLFRGKGTSRLLDLRAREGGPRFFYATPYRPKEQWGDSNSVREILNPIDMISTQTEVFAQDLIEYGYTGTIKVLPYPPPSVYSATAFPATQPLRIGFLGRLEPQKNLSYLLQAFALLSKRLHATLEIYGNGSLTGALHLMASDLGLEGKVNFHGLVHPSAIPAAIDACHLFCFTSTTEGQCLAALEILARGRPIVATPVGALPDIVSNLKLAGEIAPLDDASAFANKIAALAQRLTSCEVSPQDIQMEYSRVYPREAILDRYTACLRELGA